VIGDKHIGCVTVDEMTVFNLYPHAKKEAHAACPPFRGIIPPIAGIKQASNDCNNASQDGYNQQYRGSNAVMIYSI